MRATRAVLAIAIHIIVPKLRVALYTLFDHLIKILNASCASNVGNKVENRKSRMLSFESSFSNGEIAYAQGCTSIGTLYKTSREWQSCECFLAIFSTLGDMRYVRIPIHSTLCLRTILPHRIFDPLFFFFFFFLFIILMPKFASSYQH